MKNQSNIQSFVGEEITYEEFQKALRIVLLYKSQLDIKVKQLSKDIAGVENLLEITPDTKYYDVFDLRMITSISNYFRYVSKDKHFTGTLKELQFISPKKYLLLRNVGPKSLIKIQNVLHSINLQLAT